MIITLQIRSCPNCHLENELDAAHCHSCGAKFRCARAEVLKVPIAGTVIPLEKPKAKVAGPEKSVIKRCVAKFQARKYDISSLHFE